MPWFCLLTTVKPGGLVVNEAFAAGLPALVSNQVGCHPDLITESETGWVHPFGDWSTLAEQMIHAASNRGQLVRMGNAARSRIEAFSPEAAAEGILEAARYATKRRSR